MTKMNNTQGELVLRWLNEYGSITPLDAMREFGIMRLAACIFNLKQDGHKIRTEMTSSTNRYGHKVAYATYKLLK